MIAQEDNNNFQIFRDCLSTQLIQQPTAESRKTRRKAFGRGKGKAPVQPAAAPSEEYDDAEELAEFIDYIASEIFSNLPPELRNLTYSTYLNSTRLQTLCDAPLDSESSFSILNSLPRNIVDSLDAYNCIPKNATPFEFIILILNAYLITLTTPPPAPHLTRELAKECEICDRSWIPLTYHHLIPKAVHAKVLKRGWYTADQLNNVAWLCRACHSFVHRVASPEELAREWCTVGKLREREDVSKFREWVRRVRWKAK